MDLNYLLTTKDKDIDLRRVLVFRNRPKESDLDRVLPWLAEKKPEFFNAYQQTQTERVEKVMTLATHVASFIRHGPGKALFVGLYSVGKSKRISRKEYWNVPAYIEMKKHGMKGLRKGRSSCLWFDLVPTGFCASWKGKLVVKWPGLERSWWRRAHRNDFEILAIRDESALVPPIQPWKEIVLGWDELGILPQSHEAALHEWRGVYYIFDTSDGKGYVGSASGDANILGRWRHYQKSGHGENVLLRKRDPQYFRFSILERVSPDMDQTKPIQLENTWKERLHTRSPYGLNDN